MKFDTTETSSLVYKLIKFIKFLADKILFLCNKLEKIGNKIPEIIVSILYIVFHILVTLMHEPWYDESVAWVIAKSASIKDIFFKIPHYEGHPSLWHLILKPFAVLGIPYETSLMLVSLIFAGGAIMLIIWKSKLPRIIKFTLPFTYYFFYQYGVISRPYCVTMLALVLLALSYQKKDEKPVFYILSLILLCLSSAYGIVLAGGLAIVWVIEIIKDTKSFKSFFKDKRVYFLLFLLAVALFLVYQIIPAKDTYATRLADKLEITIPFGKRLVYLLFAVIPDSTISYVFNYGLYLSTTTLNNYSLIAASLIGVAIWVISYFISRNKKTFLTLLLPYVLFSIFSAKVYFAIHHVGLYLMFFLFWIWITYEKEPVAEEKIKPENKKILTSCAILFSVAAIIVSLYWSVNTSLLEKKYTFAVGRKEAEFIKENHLDEYNILGEYELDTETGYLDTNHVYNADNINAYFNRNIFFNHNNGDDKISYSTHRIASAKENEENIENWKKIIPDVIYGDITDDHLTTIYGDELSIDEDYTLVFIGEMEYIYKGFTTHLNSFIYVKNELANKLNLKEVDISEYKLY